VFWFTTLTWMMWNKLMSGLATGATLLLYDGSPFHPGPEVLFDYADAEGMTHMGIGAKLIDALAKRGLEPKRSHDLGALRMIASTGSPLSPASFSYVYRSIKSDIPLCSISGGTDIVAGFVGSNPMGAVYAGEIQAPLLGLAVDVFDADGEPTSKGELVCTRPHPSMPLGFLGDDDGARYHASYFERYPHVWHHGDFVERTEHGGFVIHGRSDATLNPGGVRIGTAEIYRVVESIDAVLEAICVGQPWEGDTRVVLFVRLAEGVELDDALRQRIATKLRSELTPRHVPAKMMSVPDIPRTKSGKIVELAVRDTVAGREVRNLSALANPEALAHFRDRLELGH
jgi:acetoacetyl-CoA synthetase